MSITCQHPPLEQGQLAPHPLQRLPHHLPPLPPSPQHPRHPPLPDRAGSGHPLPPSQLRCFPHHCPHLHFCLHLFLLPPLPQWISQSNISESCSSLLATATGQRACKARKY